MKKMFITLFLMVFMFIPEFSANAEEILFDEEDILTTSSDYAEIECKIEEIKAEVPGAEIDFSKGVKVYIDEDVISLQTEDRDSILEVLEESNYVWVIPYTSGSETGSITLGRGLPLDEDVAHLLTEEQKEEIIQNEGKFIVNEVAHGGVLAYYDQILEKAENIQNCSRVVIVGSQPGLRYPMALVFNDDKAVAWISLGFGYSVLDNIPATQSTYVDDVYGFWEIENEALSYVEVDSDSSGGAGNKSNQEDTQGVWSGYYVIGAGGIILLLILVGIPMGRKIKNKTI